MDNNDYIENSDNSDNDNSYHVENDEHDDEELYDLIIAGCHAAVTYYMKYIDKQLSRDYEQTGYMWLMDCLMGNEMKCHTIFGMKPHVSFNYVIFYNIHMDFNTQCILGLKIW